MTQPLYNFNFSNEFKNDHQLHGQSSLMKEDFSITELLDTDSEETEVLLELKIGFVNWAEFKIWIDNFAKEKRFNYKVRTSQMDGKVTCCIIYEYSRSDIHKPQISSDLTIW